jgi:hypothetical protein
LAGTQTNVFIFGNTIGLSSLEPNASGIITANNLTGLVFENNFINPVLVNNQLISTYFTNVANLSMDNNYDLFGNYLYSLNIPTVGGVPVTSFGLSLISSIEASSALTNLGLPANPAVIVTNNETGVTLGGTFSGDGSGLTNLNTAPFSALAFGTMICPASGQPYYLANSAGCTITNGTSSSIVGIQFNRPAQNTFYILLNNLPSTPVPNITRYTNGFTFQSYGPGTNYFVIFSQ